MTSTKKITLTTIKSFVRKNSDKIHIKVQSSFSGMTDCVEQIKGDFSPAVKADDHIDHTLGISGAWFVGQSRDYFRPFENDKFTGYEVSNSCGNFYLAIPK